MKLDPSDPRLTAYALGELAPDEAAEVEAALAEDADLRALVDEIRLAAGLVSDVLQLDAAPELTPKQRAALSEPPRREPLRFRASRRARALSRNQYLAVAAMLLLSVWAVYDMGRPVVWQTTASTACWLNMVKSSQGHAGAQKESCDSLESYDPGAAPRSVIFDAIGGIEQLAGAFTGRMTASVAGPDTVGSYTGTFDSPYASGSGSLAAPSAAEGAARSAGEQEADNAAIESRRYLSQVTAPAAQYPAPGSAAATMAPEAPRTGGAEASAVRPGSSIGGETGGETGARRMIVKNADVTLEVTDVSRGLSRIEAVAAESGGYVLETRTDLASGTPDRSSEVRDSAVIRIGVPVDRFESALGRIREVGLRVLSETASGSDVSSEYVDAQSQIANLEATQARIRAFLDRATTVEEALRVNSELTAIEGQISELKGRLQYLAGRAAYSTISVSLVEALPSVTPSPTFTPTPSPTPTPVPGWSARDTAGDAYATLRVIGEAFATLAIWLAVVVLPVAVPVVAVAWAWKRFGAKSS